MSSYHYLLQHEFSEIAKQNPEKTALIIDNKNVSYDCIYKDCLYLTPYFKLKGVSRGDRVWIQSGNTYLTIIAFWASLFCDAVPCIIDEGADRNTVSDLIESLTPALAVVAQCDDNLNCIFKDRGISLLDTIDVAIKCSFDARDFKNTESDLAMIMHTSGSTGMPKGVMLSHRNVVSAIHAIRAYLKLTEHDIVLSVLPLHFDYGLYQMLLCFSIGATLVLEKNAFFPTVIAHHIVHNSVTVLPCVPSFIQLLYAASMRYSYDFSSIRVVTNTGENLSLTSIQKIKNLFTNATLFSMFGLTECKRCSYVPPHCLDIKADSIGIPMPNLEMMIQDSQGNPLRSGEVGELVICGPTVMMGYWKKPDETSRKIRFSREGKRVLLTGDKATMDEEGFFYFKGRGDSLLKYKGAKLPCQPYIEKINAIDCVLRSHLFINDNLLFVCVELENDVSDTDQLKLSVLRLFPSIQQPDFILCSTRFPALSNGKLDKRTLEKNAIADVVLI